MKKKNWSKKNIIKELEKYSSPNQFMKYWKTILSYTECKASEKYIIHGKIYECYLN